MKKKAVFTKKEIVTPYLEAGVRTLVIGAPMYSYATKEYNPDKIVVWAIDIARATVAEYQGLFSVDKDGKLTFRYNKKDFQKALDSCGRILGIVPMSTLERVDRCIIKGDLPNYGLAFERWLTGKNADNKSLNDGSLRDTSPLRRQTKTAERWSENKRSVQIKYCGSGADGLKKYRLTGKMPSLSKSNAFAHI